MGMDQIHTQNQQSIRTNNEDMPKTKNKPEDQMKLLQKVLHMRQ